VGIIVGGVLLGAAIKYIRNLLEANWTNRNFVLFYVVVLQSFGMSVVASGFSSAVMGMLMIGAPLLGVMKLVTVSSHSQRSIDIQEVR
jgi:hypothetical protein